MNDRFEEIDNFLKYFAKIYEQNPDVEIRKDTFYHELCGYDYNDSPDQYEKIGYYFDQWKDRFRESKSLDVFHSPAQKRFLQFHSKERGLGKEYKLYLSFSKDNIFESVNKVFDFIDENNIVNFSKVADMIRSDDVVLRIQNKDDVDKVINFINNDEELVKNAKKTNPFLLRNGVVGYAYDNYLSYNDTVCNMIKMYFDNVRKNSSFDNVSFENFRNFVNNAYHNTFVSCNDVNAFINQDFFQKRDETFYSDVDKFINYKEVIQMLNYSLENNTNMNNYYNFVESNRSKKEYNRLYDKYDKVLSGDNLEENDYVKDILDNYIALAINKYGSRNTSLRIKGYISGDPNVITREGNFRKLFTNFVCSDDILRITDSDIDSYVKSFIEKENNDIDAVDENKYSVFCDACRATLDKYNYKQLYCAVTKASYGEFKFFSNGDGMGYRVFLKNNVNSNDINTYCNKYLTSKGYELDDNQDLYTVFCDLLEDEKIILEEKNSRKGSR